MTDTNKTPTTIWLVRFPDGAKAFLDSEPADYMKPYATAYTATPASSAPSGGMQNQAEFREACQRRGMEPSQELFTLWQDARATTASSATSGEAVELPNDWRAIIQRVRDRYPTDIFPADGTSQDCASARFARRICDNIIEAFEEAAHPAAAPDSAQQGEDEPPLPQPDHSLDCGMQPFYRPDQMHTYARTYHAHMMRKLGDGVSIDTREFRRLMAAWFAATRPADIRSADVDCIAHINATLKKVGDSAYCSGFNDGQEKTDVMRRKSIEAEAKLAQARAAGAERAVPDDDAIEQAALKHIAPGWKQLVAVTNRDSEYRKTEQFMRLKAFLQELAAAPSPAAAKEGGDA